MNGQLIGQTAICGSALDEDQFHYVFGELYGKKCNRCENITARDVMLKDFGMGVESLLLSSPLRQDRAYILRCTSMAVAEWLQKLPPRAQQYIESEPVAREVISFLAEAKHILKAKKNRALYQKLWARRNELLAERNALENMPEPTLEHGQNYAQFLRRFSLITMLANILNSLNNANSGDNYYTYLGGYRSSNGIVADIRWLTRLTKPIPQGCGIGNIGYNKGLTGTTEYKYVAQFVDIFLDIFADPSRQPNARRYM